MAKITISVSASVAIITVAALMLRLSAAAGGAGAPSFGAIGMPGCETSCGNVSVPYPFGIGPSSCYLPGFNLNCDRLSNPPRLLIGDDGTFRIVEITLRSSTVRVVRAGAIINATSQNKKVTSDAVFIIPGGDESPYLLTRGNELVLTGCNTVAVLLDGGAVGHSIVSGCASFCESAVPSSPKRFGRGHDHEASSGKYCSGIGCCQTPIYTEKTQKGVGVRFSWLNGENNFQDILTLPSYVFIAEEGWFDKPGVADKLLNSSHSPSSPGLEEIPIVLHYWILGYSEAKHSLCKSKHSIFVLNTCECRFGFDGNPYVTDGCIDVDECEQPEEYGCFGECTNLPGKFECRCPRGAHGNHTVPGGCVKSTTDGWQGGSISLLQFKGHNAVEYIAHPLQMKPQLNQIGSKLSYIYQSHNLFNIVDLTIGIGVGCGTGAILLILIAFVLTQKLKRRRKQLLKKKFFLQNRGRLLQQLVSQRADIAERMIIPLEELEKATNNFDKTRELGGGGHGTVYKGILSDLHVVAIKKPKMVIQKEIDEFINEVAILSQINHRNVVKLYGCCLETEVPMLVYEFISNGTLYDHLHTSEPKSLSWDDRLRIATETAKSIAYLHMTVSIPIIHRDIKSAIILLDDTLAAKVADFGASRYIPVDKTGVTTIVQGTRGYLDPMYLSTGRLTEKSDVYSFGVMLLELLTRKKPFSYLSSEGDGLVGHFATLFAQGNLSQILDPQVVDEGGKEVEEASKLALACLKITAEDRPTMRHVELTLEGLQASKRNVFDNVSVEISEQDGSAMSDPTTTGLSNIKESSRQYSMEEEYLLSSRYPR